MKTISKPLALTAAIALSLSASAWAAAPAAATDAFTVLTLEQTPGELDAAVVAAQALDAPQQFGLFNAPNTAAQDALAAIDPDELTPKQALEALYRLKTLL